MPTGSVTPAGGAAFNGGTITAPLTVDVGALASAGGVTIQGTSGANVDRFAVDFLHQLLELTGDGNLVVQSDDTLAVTILGTGGASPATLSVSDQNVAHTLITLDSQDGLSMGSAGGLNPSLAVGGAFKAGAVASGFVSTSPVAPATHTLSTGTGYQFFNTRDTYTHTPVTFNPTAGAAATCVVAIGLDNTTPYALGTLTEPAGIALDGTINVVSVFLPTAWYLKLTVTNATIGTTTYY